ncbi:hypothetical protein LZQ00_08935 [Sphingobacterium sp. SRCM116780]|uniref:hypothetical protein n=1 Tax=Sphingobacterium sp. SRCM116780 TaxID=2907623 RepID=UPI001F3A8742|nr:hypothetical protein [Sphingobacterium sp. SRCM116780]UIR57932.1 hypothetical protein LZQ00_08935 [Sphingobacterium sp. SRCM116780]
MIILLFRAYFGWKKGYSFSKKDTILQVSTLLLLYLQFVLGITLYFESPIVDYFLENFKEAIKLRQVRFFGMEHITMMAIGIFVFSIGVVKGFKKESSVDKFRTIFIYTAWTILIIFTSIPWEFSPLTSRPSFRAF